MSDSGAGRFPGPERDFVGYGPEPPRVTWPGGALVAVNLVVNHEEGGEYSLADDGAAAAPTLVVPPTAAGCGEG